MDKTYKSDISEGLYKMAEDLHEIGAITDDRLQEYAELCIEKNEPDYEWDRAKCDLCDKYEHRDLTPTEKQRKYIPCKNYLMDETRHLNGDNTYSIVQVCNNYRHNPCKRLGANIDYENLKRHTEFIRCNACTNKPCMRPKDKKLIPL